MVSLKAGENGSLIYLSQVNGWMYLSHPCLSFIGFLFSEGEKRFVFVIDLGQVFGWWVYQALPHHHGCMWFLILLRWEKMCICDLYMVMIYPRPEGEMCIVGIS